MEQNKEKKNEKNEDILRDLCDNVKCTNIHIIWVSERKQREKVSEKISEDIIDENFPHMGKETVTQVQKA